MRWVKQINRLCREAELFKTSKKKDNEIICQLEKTILTTKEELRKTVKENECLYIRLEDSTKDKTVKEGVVVNNKGLLRNDVDEFKREKENYQFIIDKLESQLSSKTEEAGSVKTELEKLKKDSEETINRLNKDLNCKEQVIGQIQQLQKTQSTEINSLKAQIMFAEKSINDEYKTSKEDVIRYENLLTNFQKEKNSIEKENKRLLKEIDGLNDRYVDLQEQAAEQQAELSEFFRKEKKEKDKVIASLEFKIENLEKRDINPLNNISYHTYGDINGKEEMRNSILIKEKNDLNDKIINLQKKLKNQQNEFDNLLKQKTEEKENKQKDNFNSLKDKLESDLNVYRQKVEEMEKQNKETVDRLKEKNNELKELNFFKEKYETDKEEFSSLKSQNTILENQISQITDNLRNQKERVKSLLMSLEEMASEKTFYETKTKRLENKVMDLLYKDKQNDKNNNPEEKILKKEIESSLNRIKKPEQKTCQFI